MSTNEPIDLEYTIKPEVMITTEDARGNTAEIHRLREMVTDLNVKLHEARQAVADQNQRTHLLSEKFDLMNVVATAAIKYVQSASSIDETKLIDAVNWYLELNGGKQGG